MSLSQSEAIHNARQLCRTLSSAPIPQSRAREIFGVLARAEGWSPTQERAIVAFGAWLGERPPASVLKNTCELLLAKLGQKGA